MDKSWSSCEQVSKLRLLCHEKSTFILIKLSYLSNLSNLSSLNDMSNNLDFKLLSWVDRGTNNDQVMNKLFKS